MKKAFLFLFLIASLICQAQITGRVVKIKDGDTVVVLDASNKETTVRLAGIDCPEKKQDFGSAARVFTSMQIFEYTVRVKVVTVDRYGRTIGWITYGEKFEKDLSRELLKSGLAWHYTDYDKSKYLQSLENKARKQKIGLWSLPDPIRPSEFRSAKTVKR